MTNSASILNNPIPYSGSDKVLVAYGKLVPIQMIVEFTPWGSSIKDLTTQQVISEGPKDVTIEELEPEHDTPPSPVTSAETDSAPPVNHTTCSPPLSISFNVPAPSMTTISQLGVHKPKKKETTDQLRAPAGFRFKPSDEVIIKHLLIPKIEGKPLPCDHIYETTELYGKEAQALEKTFHQGKEWYKRRASYDENLDDSLYFFIRLTKKWDKYRLINRIAGGGTWTEDNKVKVIYTDSTYK
ncbi:hypothetical protein C5167_009777 [Papaver somniferum]|uniref:NAC domain-containing protein n=1 Tax=Papaver somniferum TaxID=3469 RepID=A0A4Y7JYD9_PAPSO|nr:hypothetical protein C5167_009777 [Papaver somniferum]